MVDAYENQSQFPEGTETVTLYATDDAAGTSVANALVDDLTNREASQLGTLNVETRTIAIELDAADLGAVVPSPGSKIVRTSTICNLYDADRLYAIDSTKHSPLSAFAYHGFPVYGAYAYKNTDGTGGIVRMKTSYSLRNITVRNTLYTGASVTAGANVNATYPLGSFQEDYGYTAPTSSDYLDEHNGRFCVTPEYPNGTYCYFATVDANWNSAYPNLIGPTYYGTKVAAKVGSIPETVTTYTPSTTGISAEDKNKFDISVFPNPANDFIAVQLNDLTKENLAVVLFDIAGKQIDQQTIYQGSTIAYFDTRTLYNGEYIVKLTSASQTVTERISIMR